MATGSHEVNGMKSTARLKLKSTRQKERLQKWKEHFKNMVGKPTEIADKPTEEIINDQLDSLPV